MTETFADSTVYSSLLETFYLSNLYCEPFCEGSSAWHMNASVARTQEEALRTSSHIAY